MSTDDYSLWFTVWALLGGFFNFPIWTRLILDRVVDPKRVRPAWRDPVILLRFAIATFAFSVIGFYVLRVLDIATGGLQSGSTWTMSFRPPFIWLQGMAELIFIWISQLNGRRRYWRAYLGLSAGWSIAFLVTVLV